MPRHSDHYEFTGFWSTLAQGAQASSTVQAFKLVDHTPPPELLSELPLQVDWAGVVRLL
jgi:hypothetical protein